MLAFALAVRAFRIDVPANHEFDEIYYVPAAADYLGNRPDANNVHPPLGKIQIAAGMLLMEGLKGYGLNPLPDAVGWRLTSLLTGMGTLLGAYYLALFLTESRRTALFTVFLLSIDFMQLVESRIAKLDEVQSFWIVAGLAATAYSLQRRYDLRVVTLAGLCFGCATACKWNGLFAAAGSWLCFWILSPRVEEGPHRLRPLQVAGIFAVTIASVYVLSYLPLALREGGFGRAQFNEIVGYHVRMWRFRNDPAQFHHRYQCSFLSWPLVKRPVWFFYEQHESTVRGIVALGSPPFWWIAFLLLLELTFFSWKRKDRAGQFLAVTYMFLWLPWAASSGGGFIYYMLPATPLMAIVVGRELTDWWQEKLSRRLAISYCGLLLLFFILFFPLLTALPIGRGYFDCLFFYHGWI